MNRTIQLDPCFVENGTATGSEEISAPNVFIAGVIVAILGSTGEQLGLTLWKLAENRARDRLSPRDDSIMNAKNDRLELKRRIRRSIMGGSVDSGHSSDQVMRKEAINFLAGSTNNNDQCESDRQNSMAGSSRSIIPQKDVGRTALNEDAMRVRSQSTATLSTVLDGYHVEHPKDLNGAQLTHEQLEGEERLRKQPSRQEMQDLHISVPHSSSQSTESNDHPFEPSAAHVTEIPSNHSTSSPDLNRPESVSHMLEPKLETPGHPTDPQGVGPNTRRPGRRRCLEREGILGLVAFIIFVGGNGLNFVALGLIQESIVTLVGAWALVINIATAKVLLGESPGALDKGAVVLIMAGIALSVFGSKHHPKQWCIQKLVAQYKQPSVAIMMILNACVIASLIAGQIFYRTWQRRKGVVKMAQSVRFSYMLAGGQISWFTVLFGKSFSTLLLLTFAGDNQFTDPFAVVIVVAFLISLPAQLFYVAASLSVNDALFHVPNFFIFYNLGSFIGGALLFGEMDDFAPINYALFVLGVVILFSGVLLVNRSQRLKRELNARLQAQSAHNGDLESFDNNLPEPRPAKVHQLSEIIEHHNPSVQNMQSNPESAISSGCSCAALCPEQREGVPDTSLHPDEANSARTLNRPSSAAGVKPVSKVGITQHSLATSSPSIAGISGRTEMFGSPQSQHVYRGFESGIPDTDSESGQAIQIRRELPPSPTARSHRSLDSAADDLDGERLDKASPLACSSPKMYNYPSPMLLPQQVLSDPEALPERQQRKHLSWLWQSAPDRSAPDREKDQAGSELTPSAIVRRASESAMVIISAYADAHTVCRRVSAMPSSSDLNLSSSCRLDPCRELDEPSEGPTS